MEASIVDFKLNLVLTRSQWKNGVLFSMLFITIEPQFECHRSLILCDVQLFVSRGTSTWLWTSRLSRYPPSTTYHSLIELWTTTRTQIGEQVIALQLRLRVLRGLQSTLAYQPTSMESTCTIEETATGVCPTFHDLHFHSALRHVSE